MIRRPIKGRGLGADEKGATILEFAFVLPVLVLMLMFMFDTGFYFYVRSVLTGEMQKAARSSTLETATTANQALMDSNVLTSVQRLVASGTIDFSRKAYKSYGRAQAKAETFTDGNGDGICNNNEAFDDANANGTRDLDSGVTGQGSAKDVTIYTAVLHYPRMFPFAGLLGWNNEVTITDTTILRNQPFDKQPQPKIGHCT